MIYWRNEEFRRCEWLDRDIARRVYAHRHDGYYFEPDGSGGMTLVRWYGNTPVINVPAQADGMPVTSIGNRVFAFSQYGCTEAVLPDTVTSIGDSAFEHSALSTVTMHGVKRIGSKAFAYCSSLRQAILPDCTEYIAPDAFEGCGGLQLIFSDCPADIHLSPEKKMIYFSSGDPPKEIPEENTPVRTTDPDDFLILPQKYRADDVSEYFAEIGKTGGRGKSGNRHFLTGCRRDERTERQLLRQAKLLRKYLGIRLELCDSEQEPIQYTLNFDTRRGRIPGWLHIEPAFNGYMKITVTDLPAAVARCNEMITEYLGWCAANNADPYSATVIPCGRTPYYFNVPCPCAERELLNMLIPKRLAEEWTVIDNRQIKGELNMYLGELYEKGDLIVDVYTSQEQRKSKKYVQWFGIPGLLGGVVIMDTKGDLFPYITSIVNGRHATIGRYMLGLADSLYPSSLNDFCDLPPETIKQILSAVIPKLEKASGIHRSKYMICGSCKADVRRLDKEYEQVAERADKRRNDQMIMAKKGTRAVRHGIFPIAEITLSGSNIDISEMIRYSQRQRREDDLYCAERYGWNIESIS